MTDRDLRHSHPLHALPHLFRTAENCAMHAALTSAKRVVDIGTAAKCALAPGYRLIRVDGRLRSSSHVTEIALVNDVESSVVYYNAVIISTSNTSSGKKVAQPLIWLTPNALHATTLSDLAPRVLFGYIAEQYDVLLSSNHQNGKSRFFWLRQLSNALAHGLHVYHYNLVAGDYQKIASHQELKTLQDLLWSSHENHEPDLAVLTSSPFP